MKLLSHEKFYYDVLGYVFAVVDCSSERPLMSDDGRIC